MRSAVCLFLYCPTFNFYSSDNCWSYSHMISTVSIAHTRSLSLNMHVKLAGDVPVFRAPCGCDISEKSATAILRFTSDSTHHKPQEERVENYSAQANVVWPGTFLTRNRRLARNATACHVVSFIVLGVVLGELLYVGSWQYISVNFQINISAIPCWKQLWMDSFFLRSPPDEGQSEEHTDWGYRRQSCWMSL